MKRLKTYLLIDSRDRDTNIFSEPNAYIIPLENVVKNVTFVSLIYAVYPKHGTEFYTNLSIDEFAPNAVSNNRYLRDSFTQLPLLHYYNEYNAERLVHTSKHFDNPISKLGKLTINFFDFNGELSVMGEHLLKFEIEYICYDGNPEMNTLSSNIFGLNNKTYTKKELNRAYRNKRRTLTTPSDIAALKEAYLELHDRLHSYSSHDTEA